METFALLTGILAAVVYVAERLAFAIIVYLLSRWTLSLLRPVLTRTLVYLLVVRAWVQLQIFRFQRWLAMRALRSQLAGGATP